MSLIALAVRLCAVEMLRNATMAGPRVFDSAISPFDLTKNEDAAPTIMVAIDESALDPEGRDVLGTPRTVELIIELACASSVRIPTPDDGDDATEDAVVVPHTDEGLELILDLMGRQVDRAMLAGNEWSDLFLSFVDSIERVSSRRGAGSDKGVRFAAHQLIFSCSTMAEPGFGPVDADGPWGRLLAAMRRNPELTPVADLLQAEIEAPDLPAWRRAAADIGLRHLGAMKIGIGPALDDPALNEIIPPLDGAEVPQPSTTWVLDPDRIAEALPPED